MSEYIVRETDCGLATKQEIVGELVRCRECKYYWKNNNDWMITLDCVISNNDDGFCHRGERKEE